MKQLQDSYKPFFDPATSCVTVEGHIKMSGSERNIGNNDLIHNTRVVHSYRVYHIILKIGQIVHPLQNYLKHATICYQDEQ